MKLNQVDFYYYTALNFDTVFKTQVIGWINLYQKHNISFKIVKQYSIKYFFKKSKIKQEFHEIEKLYHGVLSYNFTLPDKNLLFRFFNIILFLFPVCESLIKGQSILIQTRGLGYYPFCQFIKNKFAKRVKIIYDSRATIAEEYLYNQKFETKESKQYKHLLKHEQRMVQVADKVFCVSNNLIDYHMQQNPLLTRDKFFYYPGNADKNYFFFDLEERKYIRKKNNLENKIVVVYSGGLLMSWHIPELLFEFFKKLKSKVKNAFFLVLTNDVKQANLLAKQFGLSFDDYNAFSAGNRHVRKYLNASDFGLLLREDVPMNNVASPTKFAEYMLCGLPTIISPNAGDFSDLINNKKFGFIYQFEDEPDIVEFNILENNLMNINYRKKIAKWADNLFSKQSNLENILDVYKNIFKG